MSKIDEFKVKAQILSAAPAQEDGEKSV